MGGKAQLMFLMPDELDEETAAAVAEANARTGYRSIYTPNVTAPHDQVVDRAHLARVYGAGGILISPGLTGFDAARRLAEQALADQQIDGLAGFMVDLMDRMGLWGAALAVGMDNLFPPIPSEIVLPMAGLAASQGTYHLAGESWCSRFDFATAVFAHHAAHGRSPPRLRAVASAAFPAAALRPGFSALDSRRALDTFGVSIPRWQTTLDLCLDR